MKKHYYAIVWKLNAMQRGKRFADYARFTSRQARDRFIEEGAPYRGAGYREAVDGRDSEIRALTRAGRWDWQKNERGFHTEDTECRTGELFYFLR